MIFFHLDAVLLKFIRYPNRNIAFSQMPIKNHFILTGKYLKKNNVYEFKY